MCVITTGFQARSRGGRWSWTLSPEEIMSREVELGCESWIFFNFFSLRVVPQQQCNRHCLCDSAQARQLKQQLRGTLVAGQWRGDTALILSGGGPRSLRSFSGGIRAVEPSLFRSFLPPPPPPTPPSLISILASVDVKQYGQEEESVRRTLSARGTVTGHCSVRWMTRSR